MKEEDVIKKLENVELPVISVSEPSTPAKDGFA